MALKELLRNKIDLVATAFFIVTISSCNYFQQQPNTTVNSKNYFVDTSGIPKDTVFVSDNELSLVNGLYKYDLKNKIFKMIKK